MTQSFFHSVVAGAVVEIAVRAWDIRKPSLRQKFHLLAIAFPVFSFPLFQAINPTRGSVHFRLGALFDSNRWLYLPLPGGIPAGAVLLAVLSLVALIFLLQELVPIVRNAFESRKPDFGEIAAGENPKVIGALEELPVVKPDIYVLPDDELLIFSSTGKHSSIYVSSALLDALSAEQLQAALAHEIAHIVRSRRPLLILVYVLRIVMFFNPVVLVAFRRAAQEDEKICDEMAVAVTGKPRALADTLRKLYAGPVDAAAADGDAQPSHYLGRLENYSHRMDIESRIERLEADGPPEMRGGWLVLALTLLVAGLINYFVV